MLEKLQKEARQEKRIIVGIGHKRSRGKTTIAKLLKRLLCESSGSHRTIERAISRQNEILSFADIIKQICMIAFNIDSKVLQDTKKKNEKNIYWKRSPRDIMQSLGDIFKEKFGEDFWVEALRKKIIEDYLEYNVIIDDVRFKNEAKMIKELGGILIKVERDVEYDEAIDNHQSEKDLDDFEDWDYVLDNNQDLEKTCETLEYKIANKKLFKNKTDRKKYI